MYIYTSFVIALLKRKKRTNHYVRFGEEKHYRAASWAAASKSKTRCYHQTPSHSPTPVWENHQHPSSSRRISFLCPTYAAISGRVRMGLSYHHIIHRHSAARKKQEKSKNLVLSPTLVCGRWVGARSSFIIPDFSTPYPSPSCPRTKRRTYPHPFLWGASAGPV